MSWAPRWLRSRNPAHVRTPHRPSFRLSPQTHKKPLTAESTAHELGVENGRAIRGVARGADCNARNGLDTAAPHEDTSSKFGNLTRDVVTDQPRSSLCIAQHVYGQCTIRRGRRCARAQRQWNRRK